MTGTIKDPSGAVVPKAMVTVTNRQTGLVRDASTDDSGRFNVLSLLPGQYEVKVSSPGFRALTQTVEVTINTVRRVDAKLDVGQITDQVTVAATSAMLQTDKSDVRTELDGKVVQNLPLPGYRNYQSLMALIPEATPPAFQNAVVDTPGRALRSVVNGTATNNNNAGGRRGEHQYLAAAPYGVCAADGIDRDDQHHHRQLRRGIGNGRRRGDHVRDQVRHEQFPWHGLVFNNNPANTWHKNNHRAAWRNALVDFFASLLHDLAFCETICTQDHDVRQVEILWWEVIGV